MLAADILDDGLVELVAGHLDGGGLHHAGQGDDRNIGGAAADVHHQMAVGLGDIDARADGGGHRLLDQIHLPCARLNARVNDAAFLHLGNAGRHADDHAGLEQTIGHHLANELPEHPFGHVVIGDDALPQGADGDDVARGAPQHFLRLTAHFQQLASGLIHGHHAGLPQHDALAPDVNQHRRGAQINTNVSCQSKHSNSSSA